tara:strand:- start:263 stop:739 length:477 start_codon:yes stop_codon:yes gene_type:complete
VFEQIILENSSEKQSKLLGPAERAYNKPDIGVKIQNKSAYYVIRDCAMITQKYLVLHIWGAYDNPFKTLKGKFTKSDVTDFLKRSKSDETTNQIKDVIISSIRDNFDTTTTTSSSSFDYSVEADDIYSYYGQSEQTEDDFVEQEMTEEEMLLKFFHVK